VPERVRFIRFSIQGSFFIVHIMGRLENRIAVITASGAGMGEGIARLFADEGARVVISDIDETAARAVAESIISAGGAAMFQRADVSLEADCRLLINRAVQEYGGIDVLVNNAGISTRGNVENTTVEMWDKIFAVNVRGAFVCTQQAVTYMKEQRRGSIINIGSINAYIGEPKLMAYSASKGALMTLTKNTASYLNQYGIRVNQLNPGWTLTPNEQRVKREEGKGEDWVEEAIRTRAFGRLLTPRDIALAALYFASDESECVTGSVLDLEQFPVGAPPNW
jgi:NAD(P)-dependent dehydrogenase (short-subunit alcohol dehydrogenase family)